MRSIVASPRARAIIAIVVAGACSVLPGSALAQSTSSQSSSQTLVARCDLPVVNLFNPSPGDMVLPGAYMISGLALDPMAQQASGIDEVTFFLGDRDHGGASLGSVIPSGGPRLDDFTLSITIPNTEPGTAQQLQVFAHSALSGKETQLTIPIVIGSSPSRNGQSASATDMINTNPGALPASCAQTAPAPLVTQPASPLPNGQQATGAATQAITGTELFGIVSGFVSSCANGAEQPISQVTVQAQGTSATAQTDINGEFLLTQVPAPGMYTIAVSDGRATATRMYVPVAPGEIIDIGTLQIGADPFVGCGEED